MSFGFGHQTLLLSLGERFDPLALDLRLFQHGRDQFLFTAIDLRFLHFDLLLFLDLLHFHLLSYNLLLHDVGLDVIGLVGLRLLALGDFKELGFLHFEIALRFGLLGQ